MKIIRYSSYLLSIIILFGFSLIFFYLYQKGYYTFPVLWPDEAYLLWQSYNFAEYNTLFTPQEHLFRDVMWMPPFFQVFYGFIFKIFPVSIFTVRIFALFFGLISIAILIYISYDRRINLPIFIIIGLFMISASFMAICNVARQEHLVLFFIMLSSLFYYKEKIRLAWSTAIILPLIHPNGLFFCFFLLIFIILYKEYKYFSFNLKYYEILVIIMWGIYFIYIIKNYDSFIYDMTYQFSRKGSRSINFFSMMNYFAVPFTLLSVFFAIVYKSNSQLKVLTLLSVSCLPIQVIGNEMWYFIYEKLNFFISSIVILIGFYEMIIQNNKSFYLPFFIIVLFMAFIIHVSDKADSLKFKSTWCGMGLENDQYKYYKVDNLYLVKDYIQNKFGNKAKLRVAFSPEAEGFEYFNQIDKNIDVCIHTMPFYNFDVDILIYHQSAYSSYPIWGSLNSESYSENLIADLGIYGKYYAYIKK